MTSSCTCNKPPFRSIKTLGGAGELGAELPLCLHQWASRCEVQENGPKNTTLLSFRAVLTNTSSHWRDTQTSLKPSGDRENKWIKTEEEQQDQGVVMWQEEHNQWSCDRGNSCQTVMSRLCSSSRSLSLSGLCGHIFVSLSDRGDLRACGFWSGSSETFIINSRRGLVTDPTRAARQRTTHEPHPSHEESHHF